MLAGVAPRLRRAVTPLALQSLDSTVLERTTVVLSILYTVRCNTDPPVPGSPVPAASAFGNFGMWLCAPAVSALRELLMLLLLRKRTSWTSKLHEVHTALYSAYTD